MTITTAQDARILNLDPRSKAVLSTFMLANSKQMTNQQESIETSCLYLHQAMMTQE